MSSSKSPHLLLSIQLQSASTTPQLGFANTQLKSPKMAVKSPRMAVKMQATLDLAVENRSGVTNLYDVLRLNKGATVAEVKTAYRSLVKQFHPDTNKSGSNDRDFIEIHKAYSTLIDPIARARYDLTLSLSLPTLGRSDDFGRYASFVQTRRWETDQCW
ncbi:hypothetical protein ACHQM5_011208 [Ranunculus cassubicifolius]